jgi:hypothetical protein
MDLVEDPLLAIVVFSMSWFGRDNEKYFIYGAYLEDEFITSSNKIISERISPQTGTLLYILIVLEILYHCVYLSVTYVTLLKHIFSKMKTSAFVLIMFELFLNKQVQAKT